MPDYVRSRNRDEGDGFFLLPGNCDAHPAAMVPAKVSVNHRLIAILMMFPFKLLEELRELQVESVHSSRTLPPAL